MPAPTTSDITVDTPLPVTPTIAEYLIAEHPARRLARSLTVQYADLLAEAVHELRAGLAAILGADEAFAPELAAQTIQRADAILDPARRHAADIVTVA